MAQETALPPVASSYFCECKKCGAERYHKVLAHTKSGSAKLECEVCHAKKTLSMAKKGKKAGKPRRTKVVDLAAAQSQAFEEWKGKVDHSSARPYTMKEAFVKLTAIDHPKFGLGVIMESFGHKIHVIFADGERDLVHNRKY